MKIVLTHLMTAFIVAIIASGTGFSACPSMDVAGDDCRVDLADFAVFASQWLTEGTLPPAITWVTITDPGVAGYERFYGQMSKYETTNAQYAQYLNEALTSGDVSLGVYEVAPNQFWNVVVGNSGPYSGQLYYSLDGPGLHTVGVSGGGGASRINFSGGTFTVEASFEDHPVTYVSWYGAMAFAHYYGWRLPTEREWQAVADFDGTYTYGCGTMISNTIANHQGSTHPHGTTAVGSFGTYGYGMADMAGNVWEWTSSESGDYCVNRGGGWFSNDSNCRVSIRNVNSPDAVIPSYGFRVCRDLTPEPDITWVAIDEPEFSGQMSKYETTNSQFCQYLNAALAAGEIVVSGDDVEGASGSSLGTDFVGQNYYRLEGPGWTGVDADDGGASRINWTGSAFVVDSGFEDHPVTYVSWYGATAFAAYYGWRLPTEWEWQAVADFDGSYNYGCGTTIDNDRANYRGSTHPDGTTPVGAFGTYGYGMADLAGNVREWTSSLYSPDNSERVLRGGSWSSYDSYCSVTYRFSNQPHGRYYYAGFRVCR